MLSQTSSSRLHIHELLSLPATKALVSDLLYKVLLEAHIRYATHTLRIRYAYATHTLRIRYAYAAVALVSDLARSAVCVGECVLYFAFLTFTIFCT